MMMRTTAIMALLCLAACAKSPEFICDNDGKIIVPYGASLEERKVASMRNSDLELRRYDKLIGRAEWQTEASLAKAEGCP